MLNTYTPELTELSDAHVILANSQSKTNNAKQVSAAMTLSAAKFAAYFCHVASQNREELVDKREASIAFFTNEFRLMFEHAYDQNIQNYDRLKS